MTDAVVGKLSKTLSADAPTFTAWVGMNEAAVAEALAREGFDAVILDMQHGALDFAGASRAILAVALAGLPAIVRTPVDDFATASRVIDAGAAGVIAPMINGRADAERFASFAKFPPDRAAVLGSGRGAVAHGPRNASLSRLRQQARPGDRHDRDARGAGGARRHPRR